MSKVVPNRCGQSHVTILQRLGDGVEKAVFSARQLAKLDDYGVIGDVGGRLDHGDRRGCLEQSHQFGTRLNPSKAAQGAGGRARHALILIA